MKVTDNTHAAQTRLPMPTPDQAADLRAHHRPPAGLNPRGAALARVALALALAAGCRGRGGDGVAGSRPMPDSRIHKVPAGTPLKLALVPNSASRFWDLARSGLNKFEQETGIRVELRAPPHGRVQEQQQIVRDLVSEGFHGLLISVVAPEEQTGFLNEIARRVNLVTVDSDAPASARLAFVGPRQYDTGLATGMAITRQLPKGGKIAVFAGDLAAENVVQRLRGIRDAIGSRNIQIVSQNEDRTDLARARLQVEEVLRNHPDIELLVGLWSYNGSVIRSVLKAQGRAGKVKVVAFAEEEETLQGIEEGTIACGVALTAFDFAYRGATLLRDLCLQGQAALPADPIIDTGFVLVDGYNVREFRDTRTRQSGY